jgi:hypothetical protein
VEGEDRLLVCPAAGGAALYSLGPEGAALLVSRSASDLGLEGAVRRLALGDSVVLLADHTDAVVAVGLDALEVTARLPAYSEAALACLAVAPDCSTAVLAYADQRVMEVSLKTARYTPFSLQLAGSLPRAWLARRTAVTGVTYSRSNPGLILLHDDSMLAVLDKDKDLPEPHAKLVYSDPRSTPSDDQSVDGSSCAASTCPSSARDGGFQVYTWPPL